MTYELRTYTAAEGRFDDLLARFRNHTIALFAEHGMESVGYWVSKDDPNVLIYVLRHTGNPTTNWESFRADTRWQQVRAASEESGPVTTSMVSVYLEPTDFSALS